jgi:hypothetical protein
MASANFNTQIVSSINDTTLEYNLDDVIIKDFDGNPGYRYILNGDVPTPVGVIIKERQGTGTYLIIPSSAQFDLSIIVFNNDKNNPIEAIASTSVNLEETPVANFNTKILSSSSNEQMVLDSDIREYVLDEVIDKNFPGPYKYEFFGSDVASVDFPENGAVGIAFPRGLEIIENMEGQQVLSVGPNIEFKLSIIVSTLESETSAIATTMITIEETPLANFNTEIVSSALGGKTREYVLDEVIEKNFEGPYNYKFFRSDVASVDFAENDFVGIDFPKGLEIIENINGEQILYVGPNIEFELSIFVGSRNEMNERGAIATTMITIDGKPNFSNEITKLLNNQTLQEKFSNTKNDWTNIINRSTNEKVDDGIIYPGDDLVKPL